MNLPSLDQARTYLARVLPWPQEGEPPAFCNIHWTFLPQDGNPRKDKTGKLLLPWHGRACRTVDEAIKQLEYLLGKETTRDVYACMSTQRTADERTGRNNFKYSVATREASNAVALKALFIDIDLKGGLNGYDTQEELVTSLGNFLVATSLPQPSLVVSSGGGYHVYWTLDRALTPDEWLPLAYALAEATKRHGLKCDTQCTVDSVRVLRVPNTYNRKTEPPRPVRLIGRGTDFDYSVARIASALEPYKTTIPLNLRTNLVDDPNLFPVKPGQSVAGCNDALSSGVVAREFPPIDIQPVALQCGFVRESMTTGGKDNTNPLWNLTTLLSTFCDGGRTLAHLMGRKHPGYSLDSTNELFDRKENEKVQKNIGWPSCQTISGSGSTACAKCVHFGKIKSPLNLGKPVQALPSPAPVTQPGNHPGGSSGAPWVITNVDLPPGYTRDVDGLICKSLTDDTGLTTHIPICTYPMVNPWMQKKPWELHFTTVTNEQQEITIPCEVVGGNEMRKLMQGQGLMLHDGAAKNVTEFLVSWIEKLKGVKNAVVATAPFGWNVKAGKIEGFVYGGSVWSPSGPRNAPSPDPVIASQYTPTGSDIPWRTAAGMISAQERPDLNAIVASAFGAPLVRFVNQPGLLMSAYSIESGIGKTTAMKVAQAVWGDPVVAMQGLSDTQNAVVGKIGEIRSLPLFWDELKTEDDTKKFVNIVFQLSSGKEKSRMTASAKQRHVGTFQTMMISASNESLLDYVTSRTKMTTAGLYRVFEFEVTRGSKGQIAGSDAQRMIGQLNDNYGVIGLEYARFLGANFAQIETEVGDFQRTLDQEHNIQPDERFWTAVVTSICMGAHYANQCGFTTIDEAALRAFMVRTLKAMRVERTTQPVDMRNAINVSNVLAQYLSAMRSKHTLRTNKINTARGKPAVGDIKLIGANFDRLDGIYIQIGVDDRKIRISSTHLSEWLEEKGYSRHAFTKALDTEFGAKVVRAQMCSGTPFSGASEYILEIDLSANKSASNLIDGF